MPSGCALSNSEEVLLECRGAVAVYGALTGARLCPAKSESSESILVERR